VIIKRLYEHVCCVFTVCPPQWTVLIDQNSLGATESPAYTTLRACQEFCASLATCVAIDFNFELNSCWIHTDPANLRPENIYDQPNTNQYRIDRSCESETTATPGL